VLARIQNDAYNAGAIICLIVGLLILLAVVREYRFLQVAVWGRRAQGHVEVVRETKTDKYGDVVRWTSTIAYRPEAEGKHPEIRFHEEHGYPHTRRQEVAVRYSPKRPEHLATIKRPREVMGRVTGFTAAAALMVSIFAIWAAGYR